MEECWAIKCDKQVQYHSPSNGGYYCYYHLPQGIVDQIRISEKG